MLADSKVDLTTSLKSGLMVDLYGKITDFLFNLENKFLVDSGFKKN